MTSNTDRYVIDHEWITERKTVRLSGIENAPWLFTRSGNTPIDPSSMELVYDISKPQWGPYLRVRGYTDGERRRLITRRVEMEWAPSWLRELAEKYRPAAASTRAHSQSDRSGGATS